MKQSPGDMRRVHWHLGQGLLPEHFYAQEESLRAESALRFDLLGMPSWGLGRLEYDTFALPGGVLVVKGLSLVLPSGVVVDIPGNAAEARLDLEEIGAERPAKVYVNLASDFQRVTARPGSANEEGIERILQKVELSASPGHAERSFQLMEVQCDVQGEWSISDSYVPPLLCVQQGLLFDAMLERMRRIVVGLGDVLRARLQDNYLSGETQLLAKRALGCVLGFHASLVDIPGDVHPHPYQLFCALRSLYIDMAVLHDDKQLGRIDQRYEHRKLAASFNRFLEPLERMASGAPIGVPYLELLAENKVYSCELPADVKSAVDVFLLVQKPRVATRLELDGIKLASPARLETVHERSLSGIRFAAVDRPPFAQTLSSTVEIFQLSRGEEWDHAVKERRLALYEDDALANCRLYLYFRMD